jgi:TM2 domain-containing membrane protein YozV
MPRNREPFNSGVAAILSLFVPGLGQMCQGRTITGLLCLVLIPLGYLAFIIPGLVMHLACIVDAARA